MYELYRIYNDIFDNIILPNILKRTSNFAVKHSSTLCSCKCTLTLAGENYNVWQSNQSKTKVNKVNAPVAENTHKTSTSGLHFAEYDNNKLKQCHKCTTWL